MATSYRLKYSANGGRFFGRFRTREKRDFVSASLSGLGIVVETYDVEIGEQPAAPGAEVQSQQIAQEADLEQAAQVPAPIDQPVTH